MTVKPPDGTGGGFATESSRIGLNLAALVVSRFIALACTVVQLGLVFRALSTEAQGQFGFALSYSGIFTVFATLGIQRLLVRDIARDPSIAWDYAWTALALVIAMCAVVFAVIAGSLDVIEPNPVTRAAVLMAALSIVGLWALQQPFEALLMARERMVFVAIVNITGGALKLGAVAAVLPYAQTSPAAHAAIAAGNAVAFVLCAVFAIAVVGWEPPRVRLRLAMRQVRECFPFALAMLGSQLYFKSDMTILKYMRGEAAAGLYTPAQRVTEPLMMIAALWGTAVFPALCRFSVNAPDNYRDLKRISIRLGLFVACPMAAGVAVLAEPIVLLLTGGTAPETVLLLRLLCPVIPLFYLNGIGQEFFYAAHRNYFVAGTYAAAACISVAGNLGAIRLLGVTGVAAAALAANFAVSICFVRGMAGEFAAMRLAPLAAKTVLACAVMAGAALALAPTSLFLSVGAGAAVYLGAQWLLGALTPLERRLLLDMAHAPRRVLKRPASS